MIVDFHAEATSEKVAMGWHLDGRVLAVLGTHTHVPTADGRVLPGRHRLHLRRRHDRRARRRDRRQAGADHRAVPDADAGASSRRPTEDPWVMGCLDRRRTSLASQARSSRSWCRRSRRPERLHEQRDQHQREPPDDVEVEPVRQRELERDQHRRAQRGDLQRRLAARDEAPPRAASSTASRLDERPAASRAMSSCPQMLNGESRPSWKPTVRSQSSRQAAVRAAPAAYTRTVTAREREREARARRAGGGGRSRRTAARARAARTSPPPRAPAAPRARAATQSARNASVTQQRDQRVVRVRVEHEQRVRIGWPTRTRARARAQSPSRPRRSRRPTQNSASIVARSKNDRRGVRGRQVVPLARTTGSQLERHVGVVVDGPVRVAGLVVRGEVSVEVARRA